MKLQFKVERLEQGRGKVIARANLTLQAVQGNGTLLDLVTVKDCGLCPSNSGGYALLSPSKTYEANGETKYFSYIGWPQFCYDGATNALLNAATEAGWVNAAPAASTPQKGVTKAQLQDAGLVADEVDPNDPFATF